MKHTDVLFVRLALGIGLVGWIAVLLAELGRFGVGALLAALLMVAGSVVALRRLAVRRDRAMPSAWGLASDARSPQPDRRELHHGLRENEAGGGRRSAAGLAFVVLLAAVAFLPPFESVLWASDASVYLAFGRQVAASGSLVFEDPLLAQIPVQARRELFRNPEPHDVTGAYARFPGGFLIPDVEKPQVTAGFGPLYPVLLAVAWATFGLRGALYVAPLFALLSVAAVCLVGRRLGGAGAGVLAGLLLALSLPQIWFARLAMSEVVAEFFVLSGLLALLASRESPRRAAACGALFGMAMFAKFDLVAVLGVALMAWAVLALAWGSRELRRRIAWLAAPFLLLLAHNVVHVLVMPTHYLPFVRRKLDRMQPSALLAALPGGATAAVGVLAVVGVVLSGAIVWRHRRRSSSPTLRTRIGGEGGDAGKGDGSAADVAPRRRIAAWGTALLLALLAAYAVAYVAAGTNRLAETLPWLGWYLSWPVVAAFFVAAVALPWRRRPVGRCAEVAFVLVMIAVAAFHYLYDPQEPVRNIWSVRRLVPAFLPGVFLVIAAGVAALVGRLPQRARWAAATPIVVALAALVARPSLAVVGPGMGPPPWAGAIEQVDRIAASLPEGAMVLVDEDLAGTHLPTALGYLHDLGAVVVASRSRQPAILEDTVLAWLASGRRAFLALENLSFHRAAPRLALFPAGEETIRLRTLETTTSRRPENLVGQRRDIRLFEVSAAGAKHSVDVGVLSEDALFEMQGFYGPERDNRHGAYRWSGPLASIGLTGPAGPIRLLVAGDRPPGAPGARITIRIDGRRLIEGLLVAGAPQEIVVDAPPRGAGGSFALSIESSVFRPSEIGASRDDRQLGIKVYRIDY